MIKEILKNSEYVVLKWYATLHLHQQRIIKLYNQGGITREIANRELRSIYRLMKISRFVDNNLVKLMAKVQSISIQR